jgi:cobalt/nickel transport system permease protein
MLYAVNRQPFPWRRLFHLEGFLLLLLITLPFTLPGTTLFHLGPLSASEEGLWRAIVLACKVMACVLLISFLFASADPLSIGNALLGLRVPEPLVRLFVTVVRYLTLIQAEFSRLQESMRARAFIPRSNRHTWRSYGYLLGMLLIRAMERAERVEEAMRMRGYTGRFPQTPLPPLPLSDWISAIGLIGSSMLLLLWDKL